MPQSINEPILYKNARTVNEGRKVPKLLKVRRLLRSLLTDKRRCLRWCPDENDASLASGCYSGANIPLCYQAFPVARSADSCWSYQLIQRKPCRGNGFSPRFLRRGYADLHTVMTDHTTWGNWMTNWKVSDGKSILKFCHPPALMMTSSFPSVIQSKDKTGYADWNMFILSSTGNMLCITDGKSASCAALWMDLLYWLYTVKIRSSIASGLACSFHKRIHSATTLSFHPVIRSNVKSVLIAIFLFWRCTGTRDQCVCYIAHFCAKNWVAL